jgi:hypothetical protein
MNAILVVVNVGVAGYAFSACVLCVVTRVKNTTFHVIVTLLVVVAIFAHSSMGVNVVANFAR